MNTGVLQKRESKQAANGNAYLRVQIDNKWYSLFEPGQKKVAEATAIGGTVKYTTVQKGQFQNIESLEADGGGPSPASSAPASGGGYDEREYNKNVAVRVSYALDLFTNGKAATMEDAVATVSKFFMLTAAELEAEAAGAAAVNAPPATK